MRSIVIGFVILISAATTRASEYGVFMVINGKVQIENNKLEISEAKVGAKIYPGESVITSIDSRAKIVMSDNRNIINILSNTKLKIEKYTNTAQGKNVSLGLIEGRVRNDVEQKYDGKNDRFEVRTATAVAGVRGTQFVISYDQKTKITEIVTIQGKVLFQGIRPNQQITPNIGGEVIVNKGEKSETRADKGATIPVKVPPDELKQIDRETKSPRRERRNGEKEDDKNSDEVVGGINNNPIETSNPLKGPVNNFNPTGSKTKVKIEIK